MPRLYIIAIVMHILCFGVFAYRLFTIANKGWTDFAIPIGYAYITIELFLGLKSFNRMKRNKRLTDGLFMGTKRIIK